MKSITDASAELDSLRRRTVVSEAESFRRGNRDADGLAAHFKAATVVWIAALLEAAVDSYSQELRVRVAHEGAAQDPLKATIAQCVARAEWSVAARNDRQGWYQRAQYATGTLEPRCVADWREGFTFADGRTVNADLFEAMWMVLDLPGKPFTGLAQRGTLVNISERRNRIAHGEETPRAAGRQLTHPDLLRSIDHIDDLLANWLIQTDEWFRLRGWRAGL